MKLSEYYDEINGIKIAGGRSLIKNNLKPEVAQLEAENERLTKYVEYSKGDKECMQNEIDVLKEKNEALKMAANSLLGLIDCLGGRMSLDDAGSDRKNLAELVDYPDYMNKKLALLTGEDE